ncbi:TlpA disulfide reductase family protein [Dyadobacter sp. CY312]|uniref:TlpA family protein disulfide reductase n=1 Tax=Dyadobacter sp. CY312 TaxID=2907303 RepID=UPI001F226DA2|nr:TlpA disulfide reductase family protein [Dyadobacter sp. CY312]MCE7038892.1 TlpA family protein disulfide reductase [Dyadobacter sp. CY312]
MTRNVVYLLILTILSFSCKEADNRDSKILELPLAIEDGFGPFHYEYGNLSPQYSKNDSMRVPWNAMYMPLKGIPDDWKKVTKSHMVFDYKQLVYQHYYLGNVSQDMFDEFKTSWKWEPDTALLSKKPIKCEVYVIHGLDKTGNWTVIMDSNNNFDFSDETPFYPETGTQKSIESYKKTQLVDYEYYRNGRVLTTKLPIVIKKITDAPEGMDYAYSSPQYATTVLKYDGKDYKIGVRRGFSTVDYELPEIVLMDGLKKDKKIPVFAGINKDEFISVGGITNKITYRNKGVDRVKNVLILERVNPDEKESYSLQSGYKFQPFKAREFRTGKQISLTDYKGKYVFIDFWGTWCKPCVASIPELQKTYKLADKEKIEFISIAGLQNPEALTKFLDKHDMPWPQIMSDSLNKLIETYKIEGYPYVVLVGPDGSVVSRNLRGDDLTKQLQDLKLLKM